MSDAFTFDRASAEAIARAVAFVDGGASFGGGRGTGSRGRPRGAPTVNVRIPPGTVPDADGLYQCFLQVWNGTALVDAVPAVEMRAYKLN